MNELYNVELEIEETKNKLSKLEEKRQNILRVNELYEKRGSSPLPMSEVKEEYAH